jgi:hypothetical protein
MTSITATASQNVVSPSLMARRQVIEAAPGPVLELEVRTASDSPGLGIPSSTASRCFDRIEA